MKFSKICQIPVYGGTQIHLSNIITEAFTSKSIGISRLFGFWVFLIFQSIPEREPYQLGTCYTKWVIIVAISFAYIDYLWCLICFVGRGSSRGSTIAYLLLLVALPILLSVEGCWATAPDLIPAQFHESHEHRVCKTVLHSGNIRAPCSHLSHRLQMHQSSNLLCFYLSGSLSAALLPVDIRTTQDSLNSERITKEVWELAQAYPPASRKTS